MSVGELARDWGAARGPLETPQTTSEYPVPRERATCLSALPHMGRVLPNPLGEILNDERKRELFDDGLRDSFPPCHDRSSRIDQLLLQLQRNELDRGEEQGACVFLAGS